MPIFSEQAIPPPPVIVDPPTIDTHLNYITDPGVRSKASAFLLDEVKSWKPGSILLDAIKNAISMRVNNRVFAYFYPLRKHYRLATYDDQDVMTEYSVKDNDDLARIKPIMQAAMERKIKGTVERVDADNR